MVNRDEIPEEENTADKIISKPGNPLDKINSKYGNPADQQNSPKNTDLLRSTKSCYIKSPSGKD